MPDPAPKPGDPDLPLAPEPRSPSRVRLLLQGVGWVVGLALLAWAISIALAPQNRPGLERIAHAHPADIAAAIALSILSIALNGLIFWSASRPLAKLHPLSVIGVNAIATFLAILPFKLNFIARVLIHRRRDGMPWPDLLAWFAATSALALAVLLPVTAAGLWRGTVDALWLLAALGGPALMGLLAVACGRLSDRWRPLAVASLGSHRVVRHPRVVAAVIALRLADLAVASLRFWIAARIAGLDLDPAQAALLGTTYFFLSVMAPAGTLGFAEMGTTGVAALVGLDAAAVTLVALIITAAQTGTSLVIAAIASAWIRPDKLLLATRRSAHAPAHPPA